MAAWIIGAHFGWRVMKLAMKGDNPLNTMFHLSGREIQSLSRKV